MAVVQKSKRLESPFSEFSYKQYDVMLVVASANNGSSPAPDRKGTNMKRVLIALVGVGLVVTLAACGGGSGNNRADTIYILGPEPGSGSVNQAGTIAEKEVAEINADGTYKAEYLSATTGEEQNSLVTNIISKKKNAAGVVFIALDDDAQSGQEALIEAEIPLVTYDKSFDGPKQSAVLNFSGNDLLVGAGMAYWLQTQGMKPGDTLVVLSGSDSAKNDRRMEGFSRFLLGDLQYTDKLTALSVSTTQAWKQPQIDALLAGFECQCESNNDKVSEYLTQNLSDIVSASQDSKRLFVVTMDDDMVFGILDTFDSSSLTTETKKSFEALNVSVVSVGGMQELFDVMTGTDPQAETASTYFDNLATMWYSPMMVSTAINYLMTYLTIEQWPYGVGANEFEQTYVVDGQRASSIQGYAGR